MWRCSVCGYIHDGAEAPDKCPKCGAPKEKFGAVPDADAAKIERARYTNSLHMQLHGLMENALDIAEEGIEDDLDPGCVKIFKETKAFAEEMKRKIAAELAGHMKKGKWG